MQVKVCREGHGRGGKTFDDVISQHQSGNEMRRLVGMMIEAGVERSGDIQQRHREAGVHQKHGAWPQLGHAGKLNCCMRVNLMSADEFSSNWVCWIHRIASV